MFCLVDNMTFCLEPFSQRRHKLTAGNPNMTCFRDDWDSHRALCFCVSVLSCVYICGVYLCMLMGTAGLWWMLRPCALFLLRFITPIPIFAKKHGTQISQHSQQEARGNRAYAQMWRFMGRKTHSSQVWTGQVTVLEWCAWHLTYISADPHLYGFYAVHTLPTLSGRYW